MKIMLPFDACCDLRGLGESRIVMNSSSQNGTNKRPNTSQIALILFWVGMGGGGGGGGLVAGRGGGEGVFLFRIFGSANTVKLRPLIQNIEYLEDEGNKQPTRLRAWMPGRVSGIAVL